MDAFFLTVTWLGSLYLLIPIAIALAVLLLLQQRLADLLLLLCGLGGTTLITHALKVIFARPRPPVENLLVAMPSDFSFPSAHTAQATAFALACALIFAKDLPGREPLLFWLVPAILVLLVGISRVYLRVHYISDVAAGAVLGCLWVVLLYRLLGWITGRG